MTSSSATKRNSAAGSRNLRMSQGQAMRATRALRRVTHFISRRSPPRPEEQQAHGRGAGDEHGLGNLEAPAESKRYEPDQERRDVHDGPAGEDEAGPGDGARGSGRHPAHEGPDPRVAAHAGAPRGGGHDGGEE